MPAEDDSRPGSSDGSFRVVDTNFDTEEEQTLRSSLRQHPRVLEAVKMWWDTASASMQDDGRMDFEEYLLVSKLMYKALIDVWDEEDAVRSAEEDWARDAGRGGAGANELSEDLFGDAMFELADIWTEEIDGDAYADFLWKLFHHCAEGNPVTGFYFWKSLEDVGCAGFKAPDRDSDDEDAAEPADGPEREGEATPSPSPSRQRPIEREEVASPAPPRATVVAAPPAEPLSEPRAPEARSEVRREVRTMRSLKERNRKRHQRTPVMLPARRVATPQRPSARAATLRARPASSSLRQAGLAVAAAASTPRASTAPTEGGPPPPLDPETVHPVGTGPCWSFGSEAREAASALPHNTQLPPQQPVLATSLGHQTEPARQTTPPPESDRRSPAGTYNPTQPRHCTAPRSPTQPHAAPRSQAAPASPHRSSAPQPPGPGTLPIDARAAAAKSARPPLYS